MISKYSPPLLLAAGIVAADLASKQWAISALQGEPPVRLASVLRLIYVENTGIAFGLFADNGDLGRWFLVVLATVLTGVLIYYIGQTRDRREKLACTLILGGAIGNLIDRLRLGYVVDFIDMHIGAYHWPAFNVADMAICAGGVLFAYVLLFKK